MLWLALFFFSAFPNAFGIAAICPILFLLFPQAEKSIGGLVLSWLGLILTLAKEDLF